MRKVVCGNLCGNLCKASFTFRYRDGGPEANTFRERDGDLHFDKAEQTRRQLHFDKGPPLSKCNCIRVCARRPGGYHPHSLQVSVGLGASFTFRYRVRLIYISIKVRASFTFRYWGGACLHFDQEAKGCEQGFRVLHHRRLVLDRVRWARQGERGRERQREAERDRERQRDSQ